MHRAHLLLYTGLILCLSLGVRPALADQNAKSPPNIVIIYTDDIGYGDLGCYGAKAIPTPAIDALATNGLRFTDAYATSATCTPSRYSLLTGQYAFRNKRAQILPGDAPLLIQPGSPTLPEVLRRGGYRTACIGKWHLGLGEGAVDWNTEIKPGPREVGFDVDFLLPATNDRVPCVYVQDRRVLNLDPSDPITVSYKEPVGSLPIGLEHPELLRYGADEQHAKTIINGISRIGYMTGGQQAWWVDEDMADIFTREAVRFMESSGDRPFFLFFSLHQNHVPRLPNPRFIGKSQCGLRGDAVVEADWCVGEISKALERLQIRDNTIVIFSSDNGPVITDGYDDGALAAIGDHKPAGPFRGGKYLPWEGGTRLPFIVSWPGRITPGVSDAMISQVDLHASLSSVAGVPVQSGAAPDSKDVSGALLGTSKVGRQMLLQQAAGILSIRRGPWKFIPGGNRNAWAEAKHAGKGDPTGGPVLGPKPQLFNLDADPGERTNLAGQHPELVKELAAELRAIRKTPRFMR